MNRWKVGLPIAGFLVAFLLGFVPQFSAKRALQTELDQSRDRLNRAEHVAQIHEIRDLAGRMLLDASRQNYGNALDRAGEYFGKAASLAGQTTDPPLQAALAMILESRDSLMASLSQANSTIVPELQALLQRTYDLPEPAPAAPAP